LPVNHFLSNLEPTLVWLKWVAGLFALPTNIRLGWKCPTAKIALDYSTIDLKSKTFSSVYQGILTEGKGSVQMTSSLSYLLLLKKLKSFINPKEHPSVHSSFHLPVNLLVHLSVYLSDNLFVHLYVHLYIHLSVHSSV
jgi:hypothetical protein